MQPAKLFSQQEGPVVLKSGNACSSKDGTKQKIKPRLAKRGFIVPKIPKKPLIINSFSTGLPTTLILGHNLTF